MLPKIIAFDLDGTLAESKQALTLEMGELLNQLQKYVTVVVISGGSFAQYQKQFLPHISPENLILLPNDGTECREYSKENKEWVVIYKEVFSDEIKNKVIDALNFVINSGEYEIPNASLISGEYIEDRGSQITLSAYGQNAPIGLKKTWDPDQSKRIKIKKKLEDMLPEVEISIGGTTSVDVLPKGFDKAYGLKKLLENKNLKMEEMLFVGDSVFPGGNDYSPFVAGIPTEKVKDPAETIELVKNYLARYI